MKIFKESYRFVYIATYTKIDLVPRAQGSANEKLLAEHDEMFLGT